VTVGIALPSDNEVEESEDEEDEEDVEEDGDEGEEADEADRGFRSVQAGRDDSNRDQLQTIEGQVARLGIDDAESLEPTSSDKIWAELMQAANHRQTLFHSHCTLNNLHGVASLLGRYKDDPFVNWRNKDGVNCVALAAVEGHDKMIQFLHGKGGDLNNVDRRGRTPLMEVALWGRLKVVNFLLEHGADPCAKDRKGRGAYFYSRPSRRTARMREGFSHYQESNEAELNRRIIAIKLEAFEPVIEAEKTASSSSIEPKCGGAEGTCYVSVAARARGNCALSWNYRAFCGFVL
jgi:hypothetical protein